MRFDTVGATRARPSLRSRGGRRTSSGPLSIDAWTQALCATEAETEAWPDDGSPARPLEVSHGSSIAHHGEILQGVFEAPDGRLHRALVTLPCRLLHSTATFRPLSGGVLAV